MRNTIAFILFLISKMVFSQSIVNTEKLFTTNDEGLGVSSELNGSAISGNASVFLIEYSLNFSYKKDKNYFRLLSGGEYINEDKQMVSNSIFSQFRYNYFIDRKSRFFAFTQIQRNAILLLNSRFLAGGGYRRNLLDFKKDSTRRFELDISAGIMQEEERLNEVDLMPYERSYTNYTRMIYSLVGVIDFNKKVTLVNTTYFQQYLKDLSDFRLLNETNLMIEINDWLSISTDLEYRFDNDPPSSLLASDFNINFGFVFNM